MTLVEIKKNNNYKILENMRWFFFSQNIAKMFVSTETSDVILDIAEMFRFEF